jgi:uncharacterized spore protein YtfJ
MEIPSGPLKRYALNAIHAIGCACHLCLRLPVLRVGCACAQAESEQQEVGDGGGREGGTALIGKPMALLILA